MSAWQSYYPIDEGESGQGLAEYGLILSLMAIATVAIVTVFGSLLERQYCRFVLTMNPQADVAGTCHTPVGSVQFHGKGPTYINLEAVFVDPDAPPGDPYGNIDRVEFYVDDPDGSPAVIELFYRYCFGGGPNGAPCNNKDITGLAPGLHTVYVKIIDTDGNVGTATYTFTK